MAVPVLIVPEGPVLVDKRITIKVLNLRPFQHVTVRVHVTQTDQTRMSYESYGHFISDAHGNVDIEKDASFGGTYKGVDGMGLFWSMLPVPGQRRGIRWTTRDVIRPMRFFVAVFEGHVMSNSKASNPNEAVAALPMPLANATILRTYLSDDVERREVSVGNIRGTLFLPKGRGRFPGYCCVLSYGDATIVQEMRNLHKKRAGARFTQRYVMPKRYAKELDLIPLINRFRDNVLFKGTLSPPKKLVECRPYLAYPV